jgi:hypothetical protein
LERTRFEQDVVSAHSDVAPTSPACADVLGAVRVDVDPARAGRAVENPAMRSKLVRSI